MTKLSTTQVIELRQRYVAVYQMHCEWTSVVWNILDNEADYENYYAWKTVVCAAIKTRDEFGKQLKDLDETYPELIQMFCYCVNEEEFKKMHSEFQRRYYASKQ